MFQVLEKWGPAGYAVLMVKTNAKISAWNMYHNPRVRIHLISVFSWFNLFCRFRDTLDVPRCGIRLSVSEWWKTEYSIVLKTKINTKTCIHVLIPGVGMQAGIQRNPLSSMTRTNGCTINVDTKKDKTQRFEVLAFARLSKTKWGVWLSSVKRLLSKVNGLIIRSKVKREIQDEDIQVNDKQGKQSTLKVKTRGWKEQ